MKRPVLMQGRTPVFCTIFSVLLRSALFVSNTKPKFTVDGGRKTVIR